MEERETWGLLWGLEPDDGGVNDPFSANVSDWTGLIGYSSHIPQGGRAEVAHSSRAVCVERRW